MAVRNFYIDADIDGRKTKLSGGPARKDGGMSVVLYQREEGAITTAVRIECYAIGPLLRTVVIVGGKAVDEFITKR